MKNYFLCGVVLTEILTGGGGVNIVYATNSSLLEIFGDEEAPVPNVAPLETGKLSGATRVFDLRCSGKCEITSGELKLITEGFDKIPDFFTLDDNGKLVFASPSPMGTIRMPGGHSGWVHVKLTGVSSKFAGGENYLCLGLRRRGENGYIDQLYNVSGHIEKYVGLTDEDVLELVPLISTTKLSSAYTTATADDPVKLTDLSLPTEGVFDFGAVYRIDATYTEIAWQIKTCDLSKLGNAWANNGHVGVGPVNGKENQLLVINTSTGRLATSGNGLNWIDAGSVYGASGSGDGWHTAPDYGNGRWCVVHKSGSVRYLIDRESSWKTATTQILASYIMNFGKDMFMIASNNGEMTYTSTDADIWTPFKRVNGGSIRILEYGNGLWICGSSNGNNMYRLIDDEWVETPTSWNSSVISIHGGCYANGYFYTVDMDKLCAFRSSNGKDWEKVLGLGYSYCNIAYFGNKLYLLSSDGAHCHFGYFYPNDDRVGAV